MNEAFVSLIVFYRCAFVANFSNLFAVTVLSPRFRWKLSGRRGRGLCRQEFNFCLCAHPNELRRNGIFVAFSINVPVAGNLLNRIVIVNDIYLSICILWSSHQREVKNVLARLEGTATMKICLNTVTFANYMIFPCFVISFLFCYTFCPESIRKMDKADAAFLDTMVFYLYFRRAKQSEFSLALSRKHLL